MAGEIAAGQKRIGTQREVSSAEEINLGAVYSVEGYFHPISNLSDSVILRAVNALVAIDSPIDVTYAEVTPDGHVTIQGTASHNSPVLIIASAVILILAGIGIALSISHIYTITDAVVAGGRLPGGAPGDRGSEGTAPASVFDILPLLVIALAVFLFLRFRNA